MFFTPEGSGVETLYKGGTRGFTMERILLVPHGSRKNDTIVTVEIKHEVQRMQ